MAACAVATASPPHRPSNTAAAARSSTHPAFCPERRVFLRLCSIHGQAIRVAPVENAVEKSGTTWQLSTHNRTRPKLLSAGPALCACRPTYFAATQALVRIEENRLVHTHAPALLLLLFIYKAIEEQPEPQSRPGPAGVIRATGCAWFAGFPSLSIRNVSSPGWPPGWIAGRTK